MNGVSTLSAKDFKPDNHPHVYKPRQLNFDLCPNTINFLRFLLEFLPLASLQSKAVLTCIRIFECQRSGYLWGMYTHRIETFLHLHMSRYLDVSYAAYSLCVGEIREQFFFLGGVGVGVRLHTLKLFFLLFVNLDWLCFFVYIRHVGVSKGSRFVVHRGHQGETSVKFSYRLEITWPGDGWDRL